MQGRCLHCGLPAGDAGTPQEDVFCCYGCRLAFEIWNDDADGDEQPAGRVLARMMLGIFFSMGAMVFSTALYASACFPAAEGVDHTLGPLAPLLQWLAFLFALPVLFLLGWPLVRHLGMQVSRTPGEGSVNALILMGVTAAYALSLANILRGEGEVYVETGVMVLVLVTLGRYLDARARHRAMSSIRGLLSTDAEHAWRSEPTPGGKEYHRVPTAEVRVGDNVRVSAGDRVPIDGDVVAGGGAVDEGLFSGESELRPVRVGESLHAGTLLQEGSVVVVTRRGVGERLVDRMEALVDSARTLRMPLERLSETAARWFIPIAVTLALATVFFWSHTIGWEEAVFHGLAVLLIACPCALGVATPLTTWVAMGRAARHGVVVQGSEVFERLARGGELFFDKTGTLTLARLDVTEVVPTDDVAARELLTVAASLAALSRHPAAEAVSRHSRQQHVPSLPVESLRVTPGLGLQGQVDGQSVTLGSRRFVERALEEPGHESNGNDSHGNELPGDGNSSLRTQVWVAVDGHLAGTIHCREELRPEAVRVLGALAAQGYRTTVLTGDRPEKGEALATRLGVPVRAGLLPTEKVAALKEAARPEHSTVMVGDGLNDAPVLAAADVGIAMGGGADLARETADVVLLENSEEPLGGLLYLLELSRRTVRRVRLNLFWAFSYNSWGMALAAAGCIEPVIAALLMIASSVCVVVGATGRDPESVRRFHPPEETGERLDPAHAPC